MEWGPDGPVTHRRFAMSRMRLVLLGGLLGLGLWLGQGTAQAQDPNYGRYFYYPFYYFPHNYWPTQGPQWPEKPGAPYMKPPAYMAYPPFLEPHWRYEAFEGQKYYRGNHFWLDSF
jgi:hypothetical protein